MNSTFETDKQNFDLLIKTLKNNGFAVDEYIKSESVMAKYKKYTGKMVLFDMNIDPTKENFMWVILHSQRDKREILDIVKQSGVRYFLTDKDFFQNTIILILVGE